MPYPDDRYPKIPSFPRPQTTLMIGKLVLVDKDWYEVIRAYIEDVTTDLSRISDNKGNIALSIGSYANFSTVSCSTGYGFRKTSAGTMQYKNLGGAWAEIGSGSGGVPIGTEDQTVRYTASATLVATSTLKIHTDGPENTVDHADGTLPRMVNVVYVASPGALVAASSVTVGTLGIIYTP